MRLGIIGYGRMGKWFADKLREKFEIGVFDIDPLKLRETSEIVYSTVESLIVNSDIILVATSLDTTPNVLKEIREIVLRKKLKNKIIFDIASIKEKVVPVLETFPETVKVCSIHPLFGNRAKDFKSRKIVIIPIKGREKDCDSVKSLFESLGAEIVVSDPETHDRAISITISLPYFIGVAFSYLIFQENLNFLSKYAGASFEHFLTYSRMIAEERLELVISVLNNKYSYTVIRKFLQLAEELIKTINKVSEFEILFRKIAGHLKNENIKVAL